MDHLQDPDGEQTAEDGVGRGAARQGERRALDGVGDAGLHRGVDHVVDGALHTGRQHPPPYRHTNSDQFTAPPGAAARTCFALKVPAQGQVRVMSEAYPPPTRVPPSSAAASRSTMEPSSIIAAFSL